MTAHRIARFREVLAGRLGLSLQGVRTETLVELLEHRLAAFAGSATQYLTWLDGGGSRTEVAALAQALTVAETYFFRNVEQFRALVEVVLPQRMRARNAERRLRLLSVGCATGEEPYTLAMVLHDAIPDRSWDVSIVGVDVNPAVLHRAGQARYSEWSLRATPDHIRRRWFRPDGGSLVLDDEIRRSVRFAEGNLATDDPRLWPADTYDVILCRNVIMYLTTEHSAGAVTRLAGALAPGGFLFLGHTETACGRCPGLALRHSHDTFYFQRAVPAEFPVPAQLPGDFTTTIRAASRRIRELATVPAAGPPVPAGAVVASAARPGAGETDLDRALDLLRGERLDEALSVLEALAPQARATREALILHAALLTQRGLLDRAEDACQRLLEVDGLNAGAHYLLALCRDGNGDPLAAAGHGRTAAYLDPGFAMPRLQLGLMARRRGDCATARHELGSALTLLAREDARRLLLFGGGFTRQALIALCRTELLACGGTG